HAVPPHISRLFFFFQAEDGIRDGHVTGVQTCALPISSVEWPLAPATPPSPTPAIPRRCCAAAASSPASAARVSTVSTFAGASIRSEERRVGKELRYRRWPSH